ncbi:MAG: hypothetical protein A3G41_05480 [Elusimicrobia bacterium RIFCSPLOWO2_12_FULL_59_9]|nr:MAG: hypothetical protein A3G41_05480 [Elusimicrobia bacterium RIFCSPLOWO2_12_FULL_59_9]
MWEWLSLASWWILLVLFPFYSDGIYNLTFCWMLLFMAAGIKSTCRSNTRNALWLPILALCSIYVAMLIGNPYRVVLSPQFVLMATPVLQMWLHLAPKPWHKKNRRPARLDGAPPFPLSIPGGDKALGETLPSLILNHGY